jgi:hypothetical protein
MITRYTDAAGGGYRPLRNDKRGWRGASVCHLTWDYHGTHASHAFTRGTHMKREW